MNRLLAFVALGACLFASVLSAAEPPLRVFIRSGPKTHGPGAHDHPRFLAEWTTLLNARGATATGGDAFPTAAQLAATDVLVLHAPNAGDIAPADRETLNAFLARGGGLVVIHAAAVSADPAWYSSLIGGSWREGTTRWLEAPMHLYFADRSHPITQDVSNWQMEDEIYYDMDLSPNIHVLATAYTPKAIDTGGRGDRAAQQRAAEAVALRKGVNVYDHQPQMWTYERTVDGGAKPYRAFVSLPGHRYENFHRPNYRAILLRGIVWAGGRSDLDTLCRPEELGTALRYPAGGPTAPNRAASLLEVHPEFEVRLVASEPLINKVMSIDWDEQNRLWVAETPEYPNGRRVPNTAAPWQESGSLNPRVTERDPQDRISILTDTDGDGLMDTKKVFADKLELVTSFVFHGRGVIAASAPDIWLLEDTDGDEVADKRTKLYTGLGINDTHAVINNLRRGRDGWIYATHGYSRGEVTSPDGTKKFPGIGSGVVRFRPDGSAFEQYSSRNGNTWGLDLTWDGQVFWTQPTSGTVFFHTVLPEAVLARGKVPGTTSWHGMIVNQRTFPAMTWPEQAYVQIDQVGRFTAGAGTAIYDGGAWPAKWNHSYFTTEATLNMVHHQFVRPEGISYAVAKEPGREETEFIRSADLWFRPIENRVGPDGALYLVDFYNQAVIHNDTRGPQHGPANAAVRPDRDHHFARIWRVQHKQAIALPVVKHDRRDLPGLLRTIASHPNAHVKGTALRLAQEQFPTAPEVVALSKPLGSLALARYESARAASSATARAEIFAGYVAATDDWTRSALIAGAADHAADFLAEALRRPEQDALESFVTGVAVGVPANAVPGLVRAAAAMPNALGGALLRALFERPEAPPAFDDATSAALQRLVAAPETGAPALLLAARVSGGGALTEGMNQAVARLLADFNQPGTSVERRAEIVRSLLALPAHRADALTRVRPLLVDGATPAPVRARLLASLATLPSGETTPLLVGAYSEAKLPQLFDHLLKSPVATRALLAAVREGKLAPAAFGPADIARLRNHPDAIIAGSATELFATVTSSASKDDLIASLIGEVRKPGNIAAGRELFAAGCAVCHKLGDVGLRDVGPPLAGIGSRDAAELLTHILDPNRQVEPNYWQWNITLKNGDVASGVIVNESANGVTVRNQGGDTEIRLADIAKRENTRRSLMPEGYEGLGAENLRNLIAYLASQAAPATASAPAPTAAVAPDARPKAGGRGDFPLPEPTPIVWEPGKTRVLLISGGSSHKFGEFYGGTDRQTLLQAGFSVNYTEDRDQAAAALAQADVAVISVNRRFFDSPEYRQALMAFAAAGKGIIMHHPGTWYGYPEWPELNAQIVGGGSRGHDRIGPHSVNTLRPEHPIMKGVPASFVVEDELYYVNAEPRDTPPGTARITVLAESSPSEKYKVSHPVVWVTDHPTARVVGLTIGHDERVHNLAAFKALLINAVTWASGK
ncbi:MAG TPA: PVC-type heme-binding CxxCH protein [Opitutaceae bacterium]